MEKRRPHRDLSEVHALLRAGKARATFSALAGASASGFDFVDILRVVEALTPVDFCKSTASRADIRTWQDVYHASTDAADIDLNLGGAEELVIASFKEIRA